MKRLIFTALIMISSVSRADWEPVASNDDAGIRIYFDKSTVRLTGAIVKMWTMTEHFSIKTDSFGNRYKSDKTLLGFDCNSEKSALMTIVFYSGSMGKGVVVWRGDRQEREWEWGPIIPGTLDEILWKTACGKK